MNLDDIFTQQFPGIGDHLRESQKRVINSVISGQNTLALMPTGSGKSLCYWISTLILEGTAIVISPLTALIDEQAEKLRGFGHSVEVFHSAENTEKQYKALQAIASGALDPDFLFFSPERIATDVFVEIACRKAASRIKLLVIDEAHCISQWGVDFRPFYRDIPQFIQNVFGENPPVVLCMSATMNSKDREQIMADFNITQTGLIEHDTLLRYEITLDVRKYETEEEKEGAFWTFLDEVGDEKTIIYIDRKRTKRSVEDLCEKAVTRGFAARYFHAELDHDQKKQVAADFRNGTVTTLFATSAFGMGIDIPDIRRVVHFLLPESIEQYYQQIGRCGRDGKPSFATLLYTEKNCRVRSHDYIEKSFPNMDEIKKAYVEIGGGSTAVKSFPYFNATEVQQSSFHYFLRNGAVEFFGKGIQSLTCFSESENPEFKKLFDLTKNHAFLKTSEKASVGISDLTNRILDWYFAGELKRISAPSKCLFIRSVETTLSEEQLAAIIADLDGKKQYKLALFESFVSLLNSFTDSLAMHDSIGEYLGLGKYKHKKIHQTLSGDMVRSKSEVIIANILYENGIKFEYEKPLYFPSVKPPIHPDFTLFIGGRTVYWEHLGLRGDDNYERQWNYKKNLFSKHPDLELVTTEESATLSRISQDLVKALMVSGT